MDATTDPLPGTFGRGATEAIPFRFHGSGSEYFGIWIVNVVLTILTLGIYSAWAKVRNKRYFNGNTELDGHTFDYHAQPKQILIGRIIVVVVLVLLNLVSQVDPIIALAVTGFYLVALPWVIVRGLSFNANMTSYRNIRFNFRGRKRDALLAFIVWPFLAILSLGGLIPFASRSSARFLGQGHGFGSARFFADPPLKAYYRALGIVVALILAPVLVIALVAFMGDLNSLAATGLIQVAVVAFYFFVLSAAVIYAAYSRNIGYGALVLDGQHRFSSTVSPGRYLWITATNLILIVVTVTLFIPWAKVRMARYLADNTFMHPAGPLDGFVSDRVNDAGVASGEFLDIEGFDFGF